MAKLYTQKQINAILKELQIKPIERKVTSQEAASILTWRAEHEYNVEHIYTDAVIRRHVTLKNFKDVDRTNTRRSLYNIHEVFELPLKPRHKKPVFEDSENTQDKVLTK